MIKKSTFNRIIFFVTISISYFSYRVIQNMFMERDQHDAKEVHVAYHVRETYNAPFKKLDEISQEAPFSKTIDLNYLPTTSYRSDLTLSKITRSNIDIIEINKSPKAGNSSHSAIAGGGSGYQQGNVSYDNYGGNYGGGSGGGAGSGDGSSAYAGDESSDEASDEIGGGLAFNLAFGSNTSSSASVTSSSSAASDPASNSSARLGISASPPTGISTTPSIGGTSTPMVQGPPPPPPA